MKNPKQNLSEEQLEQGLAALRELGVVFDRISGGSAPGGHRLAEFDHGDPEETGGLVHRSEWPDGLGEYLDASGWQLEATEYNLIVAGLERHWNLPSTWGVWLDEDTRTIEAGPIDDPGIRHG